MTRLAVFAALAAFALPALPALPAFAEEAPAEAICIVCHVDEGTNAPEPVLAVRRHGDREFPFCSERCARVFEKDPHRYIDAAAAGGAAGTASADSLFELSLPGGGRVATAPT